MEEEDKNEKLRYDPFSIRMHKETRDRLIETRKKTGLSWNRFINKLLDTYDNETEELQEVRKRR